MGSGSFEGPSKNWTLVYFVFVTAELGSPAGSGVAGLALAATGQMEPGGDASFPVPVEAVDDRSCTCAACGTDTPTHFYTKETGCQQG